jgi:CheY-like chemotaxis protein
MCFGSGTRGSTGRHAIQPAIIAETSWVTVVAELSLTASKEGPIDERSREALTRENKMHDTRLKSIKVVAVDDNADSRQLLEIVLERSSADAVVVGSGREALATIQNVHPDILISDLGMPEMDGYELLKNVRRLDPEVGQLPVIAFTAAVRHEDRASTRQAGFQAHLAKPLDPDKLVTTILKLVSSNLG